MRLRLLVKFLLKVEFKKLVKIEDQNGSIRVSVGGSLNETFLHEIKISIQNTLNRLAIAWGPNNICQCLK
jgi:hypothetical protein